MESFVRNFVRSSLIWLALGVGVGLSMALWPVDHLVYRPAHVHAALLGFVSMMIFGVAYHVMPRFAGRPLPSRTLPRVHLWLGNLGLAMMSGGWLLRPTWFQLGDLSLRIGGVVEAVGLGIFIYNIWKTLAEPKAMKRARATVLGDEPGGKGRPLPMAEPPEGEKS
jgi:heme/copper-type cytochrome/quinol oxidase subunit 1